jgi:hypothetical protein
MANRKLVKTMVLCVVGIAAGYAILRLSGIIDPGACISEQLQTVPNLSGTRIEIVYTNCDILAKSEAISVYFSRATAQGESWLARWMNRRTLVFRYDPGRPDNPLPSVTHPSKSKILISVPEVSSVAYQNRIWRDISIEYAIGKVYYPMKPK